MNIDKSKLLDTNGNPLTQSLFLEVGYSDYAIYTLKDSDHKYKGKIYPSMRRLYIEMEDPIEIEFANKYLLGWNHWKRLYENKKIQPFIDSWREELELIIRSRAVRDIMNLCASENGSYQAAKFLADRGWDKRAAGRPSREEMEKRAAIQDRINNDFNSDVKRLADYRNK